jgi:hypothetical protein
MIATSRTVIIESMLGLRVQYGGDGISPFSVDATGVFAGVGRDDRGEYGLVGESEERHGEGWKHGERGSSRWSEVWSRRIDS